MHSPLAAVVLCIFAAAASSPCLATEAKRDVQTIAPEATSPTLTKAAQQAKVTKAATVPLASMAGTGTPAPSHSGGGLIKTAAAGTRDDAPPAVHGSARGQDDEDHPRRGSTAMLLAALALMSGIALRRFGAPGQ